MQVIKVAHAMKIIQIIKLKKIISKNSFKPQDKNLN